MQLFDPVRGESEPDRYWTFTNAAEATPDILSPLCWSVWGDALEDGFRRSMYSVGILRRDEVVVSAKPTDHLSSPIYGRQAFNIDVLRVVLSRISQSVADDFERDVLGTVRPDAPVFPRAPLRLPIIAVKAPITMMRAGRWIQANYESTKSWWQRDVLAVHLGRRGPKQSPLDDLAFARERFVRSFYLHTLVRYQLSLVQGAVLKIATKAGAAELGAQALAAQGGVAETMLAEDAWRMARGFLSHDEFIAEHGFHGPNEGNVYTQSWREQPDRVRALAKAQANRPEIERPSHRAAQAAIQAREAAVRLLAATSRSDRQTLRFMLARAQAVIPRLEVGKAGYVIPLDGARAAARRLGAEQVDAGRLDQVDDVFFLDIPELRSLAEGRLPEARDLIAFRRAARIEYAGMTLPVSFTGMPSPLTEPEPDVVELAGVASGGGVVEGRARVVTDPNEDVELDDGDILVCKFTDPSWAPLFTLAEALVIDIGGAASHGAVVARELGIPYVIGTQHGTTAIREGDHIRVDGTANAVSVLQRRQ